MNPYPVSIARLPFLCLLHTFAAANISPTQFTDDVSINCGTSGTSAARSGREWIGDVRPKSSSLLQIKGASTASSAANKLIAADDPVPHGTARLSRSQFSYAFQLNHPGQKILRLHFHPAQYRGFQRLNDLFRVEAGPFTLLSNFSASLTAYALGLNSFVKEYCINVQEDEQLDVVFSPETGQSSKAYAFINGIEIISVPASLSYFHGGGDIGVQVVGESVVRVDSSTALEMIQRRDIKEDSVSLHGDIRNMFGMWETVPQRTASKIHNMTWKVSVDVGFMYLVRLHFSNLVFKIAEIDGLIFEVQINDMIVSATDIDAIREGGDESSVPLYSDYMVMMNGREQQGKRDLLICLNSNDKVMVGQGPLQGFEIMKLSNLEDSLAGPNPFPVVRHSSYPTIRNSRRVFGAKNMIVSVSVTLFALGSIIFYTLQRVRAGSVTEVENIPSARAQLLCHQFSLAEIRSATRNFSDAYLIGTGGFGDVYKGRFDNGGETVAIKRLKSNTRQGAREFLTEIETLTENRHVNIVSLIGYCNEHGEMILVYEFMARGALAKQLHKGSSNGANGSSLTWKQRLTICIGASRGLDYLHTNQPLIHRDVKPSNILLDENLIAKVSDFGLAKHLSRSKLQSHVSTEVKGTPWYRDPAYSTTGKLTVKSDIYAFGVVLLEVLSGRPPVDPSAPDDERILVAWARENIVEGHAERIVASNLRGEISEDSLKAFVGVAERCLYGEVEKRPTMAEVVVQLEFALKQQESFESPVRNAMKSGVDDINSSTVVKGAPQLRRRRNVQTSVP